ncbi:hypothetical protein [Nocardia nepalensis]|uniref:hypothetical protein n=1 Tax=Nocardia nepalensis TaxID=3375448 RepID=UPI003B67D10F
MAGAPFLARVDGFDIDTTGFTSVERSSITGHCWWAARDRLVPGDLHSLTDLLVTGAPLRHERRTPPADSPRDQPISGGIR